MPFQRAPAEQTRLAVNAADMIFHGVTGKRPRPKKSLRPDEYIAAWARI
jgi:hypothetical protein